MLAKVQKRFQRSATDVLECNDRATLLVTSELRPEQKLGAPFAISAAEQACTHVCTDTAEECAGELLVWKSNLNFQVLRSLCE